MKTSIIAAAIALAMSGAAYATGGGNQGDDSCKGNCPSGGGTSTSSATANAVAIGGGASVKTYNDIRNKNAQVQGQSQKQGQDQAQGQSQSNSAVGSGNSTNVTVESAKQPVSGPGIASSPSATCRIAVGVSVGGTFGGVGAFGSVEDERCADMERGRYMAEVLGRRDAAKALACKDEKMAEALGDCKKSEKSADVQQRPTMAAFESYSN